MLKLSIRDRAVSFQRLLFFCAVLCFPLCATAVESGPASPKKTLSKGGTVLLLGESILDCHEGDHRVEAQMKRLLEQRTPNSLWTIYNEAHGGEYIGPKVGSPKGVSEPLFTTETAGRYFEIVKRHLRLTSSKSQVLDAATCGTCTSNLTTRRSGNLLLLTATA